MNFWEDIAFAVLFRLMKDKKKAAQFRAALAKAYLQIQRLAESDNQLAQLINPKPNA